MSREATARLVALVALLVVGVAIVLVVRAFTRTSHADSTDNARVRGAGSADAPEDREGDTKRDLPTRAFETSQIVPIRPESGSDVANLDKFQCPTNMQPVNHISDGGIQTGGLACVSFVTGDRRMYLGATMTSHISDTGGPHQQRQAFSLDHISEVLDDRFSKGGGYSWWLVRSTRGDAGAFKLINLYRHTAPVTLEGVYFRAESSVDTETRTSAFYIYRRVGKTVQVLQRMNSSAAAFTSTSAADVDQVDWAAMSKWEVHYLRKFEPCSNSDPNWKSFQTTFQKF